MTIRVRPSLILLAASAAAATFAACGDGESGAGGGGTGGAGATVASSSSSMASSSAASTGGAGGSAPVVPTPPPDPAEPWELLSAWSLFVDGPAQLPADRVEPYQVIAPLFSDEAAKLRFLHVPEGATIGYRDEGPWDFPAGTVLVKTFAYPEDARDEGSALHLMETRLLWRLDDGWKALTYVWNEDQTDAERTSAGDVIPVAWIDADGASRELDYVVPNTNQCKECHSVDDQVETLGGVTLQLDLDQPELDEDGGNQIDRLAGLGFFDAPPTPAAERTRLVDPSGEADVQLRARSYLHANCGSCHRPGGTASQSALLLELDSSDPETDPDNLGICKIPTSAGGATCGLTFDIVPGEPDASIMICRVDSADTEIRMPPLGRQLIHGDGVELLRAFIEQLPPAACTPPDPEATE